LIEGKATATIIDCNTDDGRVVYVNLDNIITFASRGDEGGSEIRFVGGESLTVATPPEHLREEGNSNPWGIALTSDGAAR
jgi:hypothetical protein